MHLAGKVPCAKIEPATIGVQAAASARTARAFADSDITADTVRWPDVATMASVTATASVKPIPTRTTREPFPTRE